jgi:hypothetical protein
MYMHNNDDHGDDEIYRMGEEKDKKAYDECHKSDSATFNNFSSPFVPQIILFLLGVFKVT